MRSLLALALLAGCAGRVPTNRPEQALVLFDVTIPSLDTDEVVKDQSVVIEGGRITQIDKFDQVKPPPGALTVDCKGRYLLPAYADMHVHLSRADDLPLYVASGVTLVRNMWGAPIHLEWKKKIAAGALFGPTIVTAGPILDGPHPVHDGSFVVTNAAEADAAVALHKELGYDFVKVYAKLEPAAFAAIVESAKRAGLPIAGHVPHGVPLDATSAAAFRSIEHLTGTTAALTGGVENAKVDDAKLAPLAELLKQAGVWSVPTRVVKASWALPPDDIKRFKASGEAALVPAADRAVWGDGDPDPASREQSAAALALNDRFIKALVKAGAPILVGTDTGNPLVVPGSGLHRELAYLVNAGLTPREAIRAATVNPARFIGQADSRGKVAIGYRAELVLLEGNPLVDINFSNRIGGVVTAGRYYDRKALDEMEQKVAATYAQFGRSNEPFGGRAPSPTVDGETTKWTGRYRIRWGGAVFGGERITASVNSKGEQVLRSELYDIHNGEWNTMVLAAGEDFHGTQLVLGAEGAEGRGAIMIEREGQTVRSAGTLPSGAKEAGTHALSPSSFLVGERFLASLLLYRNRLQVLPIGEAFDVEQTAVWSGSTIKYTAQKVRFSRVPDVQRIADGKTTTIRRFEIRGPGTLSELHVDADGYPLRLITTDHGATATIEKID